MAGGALQPFQLSSGHDRAVDVAGDLQANSVPFLVVHHQSGGRVSWHTFEIDEALIHKLLHGGEASIAHALDLHHSRSARFLKVDARGTTAGLESFVGPVHALVIDARRGVRGLALPEPHAAADVYPELTPERLSIAPGMTVEIALALRSMPPGVGGAPMRVSFEEGESSVDVIAVIDSSDLARPPGTTWETRFSVNRALEATPSSWSFAVIAERDRPRYFLRVTFFCRGAYAGRVDLGLARSELVNGLPTAASGTPIRIGAGPLIPKTIQIARVSQGFEILRFERGKRVGAPLPYQPQSSEYFTMLEEATDFARVEDIGDALSTDLRRSDGAAELVQWLEASAGTGEVLLIQAIEPFAPFELLRLRPESDGPLLGVDRPVLRSIGESRSAPGVRTVRGAVCIRPDYGANNALPSAVDEQADLAHLLPSLERVRNSVELDKILGREDVTLMHFAGHADGDPARFIFEDGIVLPVRFRASSPLMKISNPFFFVNGCRAGQGTTAGPSVQRNLVLTMLDRGCIGLVAPLIRINSVAARRASRIFYQSLAEGTTVATAIHALRQAACSDSEVRGGAAAATFMSYLAYAPVDLSFRFNPSETVHV
jgi:hypothetical protein